MSSKHLQAGDPKPAFDDTKKFRIYSMKFCPFAQVGISYSHFDLYTKLASSIVVSPDNINMEATTMSILLIRLAFEN